MEFSLGSQNICTGRYCQLVSWLLSKQALISMTDTLIWLALYTASKIFISAFDTCFSDLLYMQNTPFYIVLVVTTTFHLLDKL